MVRKLRNNLILQKRKNSAAGIGGAELRVANRFWDGSGRLGTRVLQQSGYAPGPILNGVHRFQQVVVDGLAHHRVAPMADDIRKCLN